MIEPFPTWELSLSRAGFVSVLMPNRNHAHYLPRALDAMLAQTWKNFEIIVIDDASTDNSVAVVERYAMKDARVRVLPQKQHGGINRAVALALGTVDGEFICPAAADEFVERTFIERCVTEMNKHPTAGLCFSDPTEFYEDDDRRIHYPLYLSDRAVFFDPNSLAALFHRNYFHISPNTGLFRAAAFRDVGGFFEDLHWMSDWFATHAMALRYGACYLPEQFVYNTISTESYSARSLRDARAQRPLLEKVLQRLESPTFADVAARLRQGGIIPEYHLRTLFWLLASPNGRRLVTPHLALRIITRGLWSYLRPYASAGWRKRIRRIISRYGQAI